MTRIINDGGAEVFLASSFKIVGISAVLGVMLAWLVNILGQDDVLLKDNIHIVVIAGLLALLMIFFAVALVSERFYSVRIDSTKMTVTMALFRYEWRWDMIDRLYLDYPKGPKVMNALGHILYKIWTKLFPPRKSVLRFEDHTAANGGKKRLGFRVEEDGFVSIPLSLFHNPQDIFEAADRHHAAWHDKNNARKA